MNNTKDQYGENNNSCVLTDQHVAEIRASKDMIKVLAINYGVSKSQISKVKNYKTRKRLTTKRK